MRMSKDEFMTRYKNRVKWKSLSSLGINDYEISNHGKVRNTYTGIIIKQKYNGIGLITKGIREHYNIQYLMQVWEEEQCILKI